MRRMVSIRRVAADVALEFWRTAEGRFLTLEEAEPRYGLDVYADAAALGLTGIHTKDLEALRLIAWPRSRGTGSP